MGVESSDDTVLSRHRALLHEELNRLPRTLRLTVILCVLEGRSPRLAAEQLRWPVTRVERRLALARARLQARLARHGLAPSGPRWIAELLGVGELSVSRRLIESTVRIATQRPRDRESRRRDCSVDRGRDCGRAAEMPFTDVE
jgi:hypothetical protein